MAKSELLLDLEDHLSCPVCLDIYKDPTRLTCEHSLCKLCVDQLLDNHSIACPVCRVETDEANLKINLSLVSIIDLCKSRQDPQPSTSSDFQVNPRKRDFRGKIKEEPLDESVSLCELCNIHEAQFYCAGCDSIACIACKTSHLKLTSCSDNLVEKIETCSARRRMALNQKLIKIQKMKVNFKDKLNVLLTSKQAEEEQGKLAVDEFENKAIEEIRQYCIKERELVKLLSSKHAKELNESFDVMISKLDSCGQHIEKGNTMSDGHIIKQYKSLTESALYVLRDGERFAVLQKKICVKSNPKENGINCQRYFSTSEQFDPLAPACYSFACFKSFKLEKRIQLPEKCDRHFESLFMMDDEIMCIHASKLYKLDIHRGTLEEQGELVPGRKILCSAYLHSVGIVVIVEEKGLYLVTKGKPLLISSKCYHWIITHQGQIFALTYCRNSCVCFDIWTIKLLPNGNYEFARLPTIFTKLVLFTNFSRPFAIKDENFFVSNLRGGHIYKLDKDGEILQTFKPGFMKSDGKDGIVPMIIASDDCGCMVVLNFNNRQLLLFDPDSVGPIFEKLDIQDDMEHYWPVSCLIGKSGDLVLCARTNLVQTTETVANISIFSL